MSSSAQLVIASAITQLEALALADSLSVSSYSVEAVSTGDIGESTVYSLSVAATEGNAKALWSDFGNVCVDDNGAIDSDWLLFDAGTDRESIWAWFESQLNVSVAWLMGLEKSAREKAHDELFQAQIQSMEKVLRTFPGDIYEGDITGLGLEWRAELSIDKVQSSESDDASNEYVLLFALENRGGSVHSDLRLEYHVAEVGLSEKQSLDLSDLTTIGQQLDQLIVEWDIDPVANLTATPFLNKVRELFSFASPTYVVADGQAYATLHV